jgi:hypothetical protein
MQAFMSEPIRLHTPEPEPNVPPPTKEPPGPHPEPERDPPTPPMPPIGDPPYPPEIPQGLPKARVNYALYELQTSRNCYRAKPRRAS